MFYIVPPRLALIPPIEISYDAQHPQHVSFQCRMERGSSDSLSIEWQYLNNTPVQPTNGISIDKSQLEMNKLVELHFNPVQREHFGNYSCVAKNLADSTYSIASLFIKCKLIYVFISSMATRESGLDDVSDLRYSSVCKVLTTQNFSGIVFMMVR